MGSIAVCLLIIASLGIPAVSAEETVTKKVLVLHSYHPGHVWSDEVTEGIASVMDQQGNRIDLYIEYMDSARVNENGYNQKLYQLYRLKFSDTRFDAVIVCDDAAYTFLLKNHHNLFPSTPCIFCGVNYFEDAQLDEWELCTGIVEAYDIRGTLDVALALHPGTRQVVVINDRSTTGVLNHQNLMSIVPEYEDSVEFVFVEDKTMAEVVEMAAHLPDDAIILLMTFNRDSTGSYYEYDESVELITASSRVPVYGVWEFYLGGGIVGGQLTSGFHQGRLAAESTIRVLEGEDIRTIPVQKEVENRYMFDFNQMQEYGIESGALPEGSTIINQPKGIIPVDIRVFWGTIAGIVVLLGVVIILAVNINRRRSAEEALRESEKDYRNLAELQHEALEKIEHNLEQMAILNDHIRNPLAVIVAYADMNGGELRDVILTQAEEIDRLINKLDQGWLESEKVREFLKRHYPR